MREITKDKLKLNIYESRALMGADAASMVADKIAELLKTKESINIIFASAPSQNEFLAEIKKKDIEWDRINAFHMDEYVGLASDAPQGFGEFLREKLFNDVPLRSKHYLDGNSDPAAECKRYSDLLTKYPTDIVILGIGENTHLAFNDPHVADFNDPEIVKVVDLDEKCRIQQVNDECFDTVADVPVYALTVTMPALFKSTYAYAIVPGPKKADAIYHTMTAEINETYPSTILRRHPHAIVFTDEQGASQLK